MPSNTRKGYTRAPENYVIDIVINGNLNKDASYQKRPNLLVAKTIIQRSYMLKCLESYCL